VGSRRVYRVLLLAAAVVSIAIALGADATDVLQRAELSTVDERFSIRGSQGAPSDVVFVAIDEASIHAHAWPFRRGLHAEAIDRLKAAGAKAIAYDVQFTEPSDRPGQDAQLLRSVRRAGDVVLATTAVEPGGATAIFGGGEPLKASRAIPAASTFPNDPGGVNRRMDAQFNGLESFPMAAARLMAGHPIAFPGGPDATAWIDFRGPPGTIRTIPFQRVLDGTFPADAVRGKLVVVGSSAPSLQDFHATSTTTGDHLMPGPELQAIAADTALRGFPLRGGAGWLTVVAIVLLGAIAPLVALRLGALWALGAAVVAGAAYAVVVQLAFGGGTILNVLSPALALGLSTAATVVAAAVTSAFEREQVRQVFARFVPESVVGEVLSHADGVRLGGTRREATVMFSDLRGFTTFSEPRDPDLVITILNRYLTAMSDAILDHGGTLVAYMGDGIMAVFGAPLPSGDHADRAVAAARRMLAELDAFNAWMAQEGHGDGFKMGIGLNSGAVMSGNVGSERRLEYTAIGDTTNTAARIEGMTKGTPYQLFVSDPTYRRLSQPAPDLVAVGELEVRGRREPIRLWGLEQSPAELDPDPHAATVTSEAGASEVTERLRAPARRVDGLADPSSR
jgi:adenylate cyclase